MEHSLKTKRNIVQRERQNCAVSAFPMANTPAPSVVVWSNTTTNEQDFDSLIVISPSFADDEVASFLEGQLKEALTAAKQV